MRVLIRIMRNFCINTMTDNLNLVAQILENMDAQSRADILGKMNSDTAAKVTEIMNPSE